MNKYDGKEEFTGSETRPRRGYGREGRIPYRAGGCVKEISTQDRWPSYHQCNHKAVVDGLYCKIHSPAEVERRRAKAKAKYDKETKKWHQPFEYRKALTEIAKGQLNDPAGYAQMILDEWEIK